MSANYKAPRGIGGKIFFVILLMVVVEGILLSTLLQDINWLTEEEVVLHALGIVFVLITGIVIMVKIKQKYDRQLYEMYKANKERELDQKKATSTATKTTSAPTTGGASNLSMQRVAKDMQVATKTKKYGDFSSIKALCEDFVAYAKDEGVDVSFEEARSIFSAMAAARAIWFKCESPEYATSVAVALKKYFGGADRTIVVDENVKDTRSLIYTQVSGKRTATPLLEELYRAKFIEDAIFTTVIKDAETCQFGKVFYPFIQGCRAPEGNTEITVDYFGDYKGFAHIENKKMVYPKNFWMFFVIGDEKRVLPKKSVEYSYVVHLKAKEAIAAEVGERETHYPISYSQFNELVATAVEEHFISLDLWKKIDKVEEYLQVKLPFALANPVVREIEFYTSVMVSCGVTQTEAIDQILAEKIFPMLSEYTKEEVNQEGQSLAECIDGLFGMENLPLTHKALTDLGLD